jgi:DNA-binding Lrp family transcriptional regulator
MTTGGDKGGLSTLERKLLNDVQRAFPVCSRPYAELGAHVGCAEQEAYDAIQSLRQRGFVRRIGGIFDSAQLGYAGTLVAMKVPPERLEQVAQTVNEYHGVTHNYERDGDYNLWFTVSEETRGELDRVLADIENRTGIKDMLRLPTTRKFKVRVVLPIGK